MASATVIGALARSCRGLVLMAVGSLHCQPSAAGEAVSGAPAPGYRLEQLAGQLSDAPQTVRADLARIVLSEMAATYAAEAEHARRETQRDGADQDLRRWAAAVDRLARDLAGLAETLADTTPIRATINRDNSVTLLVADRPVEVNGPRIGTQADLERRIIERFCNLHSCSTFVTEPTVREPPAPAEGAAPRWSFGGETGPVCSTQDGLEFRFRNADDLLRKREVCSRVVAELNALTAQIQHYQAGGAALDWDALAIHTLPGGDQQRVELSHSGDSIQVYLPALAATPELMAQLRPWLIAKVNALEPQRLVIDAEKLLPPLGFLGQ